MTDDLAPDSEASRYLSAEEACRRLGVTRRRLVFVLTKKRWPVRGSRRDPFILETDLPRVAGILAGSPPEDADEAFDSASAEPGSTTFGAPSSKAGLVDRLIVGDALTVLREMAPETAQAVVTSPPFWGQRMYQDETPVAWADGSVAAFGREKTPEEYARHSAEILAALARVLKPRGTIWWNLGDSYWTRTILHGSSSDRIKRYGGDRSVWAKTPAKRSAYGHDYLKDKDLTLVPFLVAIEAEKAGLWLRSVIVWSKQRTSTPVERDGHNGDETEHRMHMPEPVADRPVTGHEYILLFAKSVSYDYHAAALPSLNGDATTLNIRSVWTFPPVSGPAVHGARFPDELPRRCILLATKPGELVLDPFAGQATTLRVAASLNRHYLGIEISPTYAKEAAETLRKASVTAASVAPTPNLR